RPAARRWRTDGLRTWTLLAGRRRRVRGAGAAGPSIGRRVLTQARGRRYTGAMTEPSSSRPDAAARAPAEVVPSSPAGYVVLGVFVAAIVFGLWGVWIAVAGPRGGTDIDPAAAQARIEALEQEVATLTRSDQISRE